MPVSIRQKIKQSLVGMMGRFDHLDQIKEEQYMKFKSSMFVEACNVRLIRLKQMITTANFQGLDYLPVNSQSFACGSDQFVKYFDDHLQQLMNIQAIPVRNNERYKNQLGLSTLFAVLNRGFSASESLNLLKEENYDYAIESGIDVLTQATGNEPQELLLLRLLEVQAALEYERERRYVLENQVITLTTRDDVFNSKYADRPNFGPHTRSNTPPFMRELEVTTKRNSRSQVRSSIDTFSSRNQSGRMTMRSPNSVGKATGRLYQFSHSIKEIDRKSQEQEKRKNLMDKDQINQLGIVGVGQLNFLNKEIIIVIVIAICIITIIVVIIIIVVNV
ncbi:MAG: hypothetical protein EZS28_011403 [Streblomastix strix]|uniref:Uncharacterized protein n=1 Tax=Streblomastix strix TaxID=222440 RepID=A0A5J4WEW3_9EUKA|nr:MAG: hypothetical protein EZS28_011403 [Streblomastix strix]